MQVHEICDPWAQRRWACGRGVPPLGRFPTIIRSVGLWLSPLRPKEHPGHERHAPRSSTAVCHSLIDRVLKRSEARTRGCNGFFWPTCPPCRRFRATALAVNDDASSNSHVPDLSAFSLHPGS